MAVRVQGQVDACTRSNNEAGFASHPAFLLPIPATSEVEHLEENTAAALQLDDVTLRELNAIDEGDAGD
jgi:hypothetical protein